MINPAILAPIAALGSWAADIAERAIRGQITEAEALAELDQRAAECKAEITKAQAATVRDRESIDAAVAKLPHAAPAVPAGGAAP